jgi:hypothetical protein
MRNVGGHRDRFNGAGLFHWFILLDSFVRVAGISWYLAVARRSKVGIAFLLAFPITHHIFALQLALSILENVVEIALKVLVGACADFLSLSGILERFSNHTLGIRFPAPVPCLDAHETIWIVPQVAGIPLFEIGSIHIVLVELALSVIDIRQVQLIPNKLVAETNKKQELLRC